MTDLEQSLTAAHAKKLLHESRDLLEVSLKSGLSGPGRLHDLIIKFEGMSPGEFKAAGAGVEIKYGFHDSPFGECLLALSPRGICHLSFFESRESALDELISKWPNARVSENRSATRIAAASVFANARVPGEIRLAASGTPFQLKVWEALLRIPSGCVLSYGDIAEAIGHPGASRAVGTAVGANSIAYLIPCHRVIRESGVLGEYRWGADRKKAVLGWEAAHSPRASSFGNTACTDSRREVLHFSAHRHDRRLLSTRTCKTS